MSHTPEDCPSPNPLRTVQAYLTAVVRSIEPQLEQLFKQALMVAGVNYSLRKHRRSGRCNPFLLATLEKLPAFVSWSFTFEQGADGRWFI